MKISIINGLIDLLKKLWPEMLPYQRDAILKTVIELEDVNDNP